MATQTQPQAASAFDRLGGSEVMERIVGRFYDLMDSDPAYARLRAMHGADLAPMRRSLAGFLTGWAGGPRHWFEENHGKCMMSMHSPFAIDQDTAGQWAAAMERAIAECDPQDDAVAALISERLSMVARAMARN